MKKYFNTFASFFLVVFSTLTATVNANDGKDVLERIRKEIQAEEKAKLKAEKEKKMAEAKKMKEEARAKKTVKVAKVTKGKSNVQVELESTNVKPVKPANLSLGKKRFKQIQNNIVAPLDENAALGMKKYDRKKSIDQAFAEGEDRLLLIRDEEKEIRRLEKLAGIPVEKQAVLSGEEFDRVHKEYIAEAKVVANLKNENKELRNKIEILNKMEASLKK